jgi:hypothetical protein
MLGFLAWLAIQAVLFVASALLAPKPNFPDATPDDPKGPRSEEGEPLPVIFGVVKLAPNVSYFGNVKAREQQEKVKTGIFSSKYVTMGYVYEAVFQAILCHGPVDEILDIIWDNNKSLAAQDLGPEIFGPIDTDGDSIADSFGVVSGGIVGNKTGPIIPSLRTADLTPDDGLALDTTNTDWLFGGYTHGGGISGRMRFYWGTLTQSVDPVLPLAIGASEYNIRYERVCHCVFGNTAGVLPVTFKYGERAVLPSVEFIVRRNPNNLGMVAGHQTMSDGSSNPAEIVYEVLTNTIWGLGIPGSYIDLPTFVAAGETLFTEDFGLNLLLNTGQSGDEIITEVMRYVDGQVQQHPVTGLIEFTLNRNDYVVGTLPVINEGNASNVEYTRPSWSTLKNEVRILYTSRRGPFFKTVPTQPIQDIASQRTFNETNAITIEFPAVMNGTVASRLGVRSLRVVSTPLGKVRFNVDRTAADFRVGRVFSFTWGDFGLSARIFRVASVDYGVLTDGKILVEAVEDIFALEQPLYNVTADPAIPDPSLNIRGQLEIEPILSESPTTGTLILDVKAGTGLVTKVEFLTQSGNRTPSAWHQSESVTDFRASVDKHSNLQSTIQWRVTGYLKAGGTGLLASGAAQFDIEAKPQRPEVTFIPGTGIGKVSAVIFTDEDTVTIKYAVSKVGLPSEATVRAALPLTIPIGQTQTTVLDVLTLGAGEEGYIAAFAYDAAGNESDLGTIAENATILYPKMRPTPTEDGVTGTLVLTPVDPQNRLTRVKMSPAFGNDPAVFADVVVSGGVYTQTVALLGKQPSRIDYRAYAMVGGVETVVDEGTMRFAIGGIPIAPDVDYQLDSDGTLTVKSKGDSDTDLTHILVKLDAAGADNSFSGRDASTVFKVGGVVRKLLQGERYYAAVRAYNTSLPGATLDAKGSKVVPQTDQWNGPSSALATVSVGSVGIDSRYVTFSGIILGSLSSRVDVFVREYTSDPGAIISIANIGHAAPGTPLYANGSLIIPVAKPSNWLLVTFRAIDALNRIGSGQGSGFGVPNGTVTIKVQAASAPATAPSAPSDLTLSSPSSSSVNLAILMPASPPPNIRVFRDGVGIIDIAGPFTASATFNYVDTGRSSGISYNYQVYGLGATGILSTTGSPLRSITIASNTISAPVLAVSNTYNQAVGGFAVTITPAAGTPAGVTWHLEHNTSTGYGVIGDPPITYPNGYLAAETTEAVSFTHGHVPTDSHTRTDKLRVWGSKSGFVSSGFSNEVSIEIPNLVAGGY